MKNNFKFILIKDFLFSFILSLFLYFILSNFSVDKNYIDIIIFISFISIYIFTSILSFFIYKLKHKIDLLNIQLEKLSKFDELTDVYKRVYFLEVAKKYIQISKAKNIPLSAIIIDIDNFKDLNNRFGHNIADKILKEIANKIKNQIREMDVVARFGSDEFIVLGFSSQSEFYNFAKRLKKEISLIEVGDSLINISVSIGVTEYNKFENLHQFLKRSEEAKFLAKDKGGDRVDYLEHFLLFE